MSWFSDAVGKIPVVGPAINSVAHNVVDPLARKAVSNIPGGGIAIAAGDALGQMIPGGDKIPGLQSAKDFLGGNGGQNVLTAAQAVNAALLGKKSSDFADNAMGSVQANWDERQPLRSAGQAGMLNPGQGIAARIASVPNRNPYASPTLGPAQPQFAPGSIDGSPESLQKLHGGFLGHTTPPKPPFADGQLDGSKQSLQSIHGGFLGHVTPSLGPARNG